LFPEHNLNELPEHNKRSEPLAKFKFFSQKPIIVSSFWKISFPYLMERKNIEAIKSDRLLIQAPQKSCLIMNYGQEEQCL